MEAQWDHFVQRLKAMNTEIVEEDSYEHIWLELLNSVMIKS